MASLHELIMGNAFKAFIENAQRETTNMQELALYSAKQAQSQIDAEKEALQKDRERKLDQTDRMELLKEKAKIDFELENKKLDSANQLFMKDKSLKLQMHGLEQNATKIKSELDSQKLIALNDADLQKRKELIIQQGKIEKELLNTKFELEKNSGSYNQDVFKMKRLELDQASEERRVREEQRRDLKTKMDIAKSYGGVFSTQELQEMSKDLGFDLGTDLESGRIEQTPEGRMRVLSKDEFEKKQKIIKEANDIDADLQNIENGFKQIYEMFDAISPSLKGPVEGRLRAPVAAIQGDTALTTFNSLKGVFLGPIARGVAVEKGVLTQPDIERIQGMLPDVVNTEEVKLDKLAKIRTLLAEKRMVALNRLNSRLRPASSPTDYENFDKVSIPEIDRKQALINKYLKRK